MKARNFFILDVVAEEPVTGNALACFLTPPTSPAGRCSVWLAMNYSETNFVRSSAAICLTCSS